MKTRNMQLSPDAGTDASGNPTEIENLHDRDNDQDIDLKDVTREQLWMAIRVIDAFGREHPSDEVTEASGQLSRYAKKLPRE